ncbi:hypothetical protein F5X68DRAFT_40160 [Plectosphaerella plurivora]|uniref:2EXR domain-containing protein n=1 Tax=Plectosphaerella plurivora TaxID=936078 RepID=A0A9P8V4F3_9PEZI|nr:hypothetical protein F5X68DRAFT_40160 [Plectosphaerella plurivora]
MADPSFTNFSRLPPEIRRQIWQAAIRPDRPGVHYFEIRKVEDPAEDDDPHTLDLPGSNLFAGEDKSLWTTNPAADPENDAENSDFRRIQRAKASSYFVDVGLWSACQESRKTIQEHADLVRFANVALFFEPDHHPYHYIRVDAKEDLFVMEMGKPFPKAEEGEWDTTVRNALCLDLDGYRVDRPGLKQAQIAFEFDKKWFQGSQNFTRPKESNCMPCLTFVLYAHSWNTHGETSQLWLIDRSIKRNNISPRPPARFQQATTSYHRILANEVSNGAPNAFTFLRMMEKAFGEIAEGWQSAVGVLECRNC